MEFLQNLKNLNLYDLIIFTVIPIAVAFASERGILIWLRKQSWGKEWVQGTFWMHPNFISRCRYPMGVVSALIFYLGYQKLGILWFSLWMITDLTDGTIARHFDLHTPEGESIDPLSDKLLYFPPIMYMSYLGVFAYELVILFLFFDIVGQYSRNFIQNKAANLFGKAKTFLAVVALMFGTIHITYLLDGNWHGNPQTYWSVHNLLLIGTVILSFCSMFFKVIPNYWYANILSILNFLCGATGIGLILLGHSANIAFGLIFLGQFLDLFDGRAAEKWGSTPKGDMFDDIADGTSFGGTLAMIIYSSFENKIWGISLGVMYFISTFIRLRRFLINKRKSENKGGVMLFEGLPSPAAALITGSIVLLFRDMLYIQAAGVIIASILMITKIPYIHFGRVVLPAVPKLLKVVVLVLIMITLLLSMSMQNFDFVLFFVLLFSSVYLIFGINQKRAK